MNEISEITPFLFLSSCLPLSELNLRKYGIKLVINATKELPLCPLGEGVKGIKLELKDCPKENIYQHFEEVSRKIDESVLNEDRVLVHCISGVSRSATLVIAYLMKYKGMKLTQAVAYVRERRSIIRPNMGFMDQLGKWEQDLYHQDDKL